MNDELDGYVHDQIASLSKQGDAFAAKGEYDSAIRHYNDALDLLPEPVEKWNAATWILTALGDAYFLQKDYSNAATALLNAMKCPDAIGNPFVHLRLGQSQLALGNEILAKDELARAYMGGGKEIFESEDPKYFDLVRRTLKEPPEGW